MAEEPHRLIPAPGARRALTDLLPETVAIAAWEFISGPLASAPRRVGVPLKAPFEGHWSARRGEYRVRYEIHEATDTLRILDIDHRRDAYRT